MASEGILRLERGSLRFNPSMYVLDRKKKFAGSSSVESILRQEMNELIMTRREVFDGKI